MMGVNSFSSQLAVNVSETSQANDQGTPRAGRPFPRRPTGVVGLSCGWLCPEAGGDVGSAPGSAALFGEALGQSPLREPGNLRRRPQWLPHGLLVFASCSLELIPQGLCFPGKAGISPGIAVT